MYRNYEDYMQTVLGYNANPSTYGYNYNVPNTYREAEMFNSVQENPNMQEIKKLYPEIYRVVYPVVQKVCTKRNMPTVTEEMISEMVEEVYGVIEPGDDIVEQGEAPLRNGDARNPRAKETRQQTQSGRRNNRTLRDLIRILILRELFGERPDRFPGRPRLPRRTRRISWRTWTISRRAWRKTTFSTTTRRTRNGAKTTNI